MYLWVKTDENFVFITEGFFYLRKIEVVKNLFVSFTVISECGCIEKNFLVFRFRIFFVNFLKGGFFVAFVLLATAK